MAKRSLSTTTLTPTATADVAALLDNTYLACIAGAAPTQIVNIIEVQMGGQATSSAPSIMLLAGDSVLALTLVAGSSFDAALNGATTLLATVPVVGISATTDPQRSATRHLLNLSYNAFGGIVRWVAAPGEEISVVGSASTSLSEISLSAFTGGTTGLMGSHVIYEAL